MLYQHKLREHAMEQKLARQKRRRVRPEAIIRESTHEERCVATDPATGNVIVVLVAQ